MNINIYRRLYKGSSPKLRGLIDEHEDDEDFITLETWNRYFKGKKPTLRNLLKLVGNVDCRYLGEKSPYFNDEGYLDFVCWPDSVEEQDRNPKKSGIHFAFGVRCET